LRWFYFALMGLTIMVGGSLGFNREYRDSEDGFKTQLYVIHRRLVTVKNSLIEFRKQHGRYPNNDEGLLALESLKAASLEFDDDIVEASRDGSYFQIVVGKSGLLSPWLVPYTYENRAGFPPKAFEFSPVNDDPRGHYSIRVDEGVFVYSVGAMINYRRYVALLWEMYSVRGLTLAVLLLWIVLFVRTPRKKPACSVAASVATLLGSAAALILATMVVIVPLGATTYMNYFTSFPRPKMLVVYTALLEKYRQAGVIKEDTFQKTMKALEEETAQITRQEGD